MGAGALDMIDGARLSRGTGARELPPIVVTWEFLYICGPVLGS